MATQRFHERLEHLFHFAESTARLDNVASQHGLCNLGRGKSSDRRYTRNIDTTSRALGVRRLLRSVRAFEDPHGQRQGRYRSAHNAPKWQRQWRRCWLQGPPRNDMFVLRQDHARSGASFLTGAHPKKTDGADIKNGISVDQVAAQGIGHKSRFASLELGMEGSSQSGNCDSGYSCAYSSNLAWRNESSPLAKEMDPSSVFERLFGTPDKVSQGGPTSPLATRRKSVLDYALEDANSLKRKLGAADSRKLDEYLYAVKDVENRIGRSDKLQLGENGLPSYSRPAGVPRVWEEHCKLMMDMIGLAIRTDATRVLTFMMANEGSNRGYPEIGAPESHHDLSHHGKSEDKQTKLQKINLFHLQQFAYLADQLSAVDEGGESLLDRTMILYGSGISDGDRHNHDDLPILMLGKAGGRLNKSGHWKYPSNTPLCNLYLWMLHQVGIKADRFGDSNDLLSIG